MKLTHQRVMLGRHSYPVERTSKVGGRRVSEIMSCGLERENGAKASFIGMSHIASSDFFRRVENELNSIPGIILTEGVRKAERDSQETQILNEFITGTDQKAKAICELTSLDLLFQKNNLSLPLERVRNSDVSTTELADYLQSVNFDFSFLHKQTQKVKRELLGILGEEDTREEDVESRIVIIRYLVDLLLSNFEKVSIILHILSMLLERKISDIEKESQKQLSWGILEFRNQRLVQSISECTKTSDVIVPWGVEHMPGVIKSLLKTGVWHPIPKSVSYTPVYRQACTLRKTMASLMK